MKVWIIRIKGHKNPEFAYAMVKSDCCCAAEPEGLAIYDSYKRAKLELGAYDVTRYEIVKADLKVLK